MLIEIQNEKDINELIQSHSFSIFVFYTPWTGVWDEYKNTLKKISEEYNSFPLYFVNLENLPYYKKELSIKKVPLTLFYKNNELIRKKKGLLGRSEFLRALLAQGVL